MAVHWPIYDRNMTKSGVKTELSRSRAKRKAASDGYTITRHNAALSPTPL
jgi:hypothetical protein